MNIRQPLSLIAAALAVLTTAACAKKITAAKPTAAPVSSAVPAAKTAVVIPRSQTPQPVRPAETAAAKPRYPDAITRARINQLLARIEDAYFDYDRDSLRPDAMKALTADATELREILRDFPDYKLTIEGHCDERGSAEYNLALGDRRAAAAKQYLVAFGIPAVQLGTVSYGKERPACLDANEACWQKNRRIHIVAMAAARE